MDFLTDYGWYIVAALIVVVALWLLYFVTKGVGARIRGRRGQRLGISEYHEVDKTRRLVLIRRDNVEHLVMIGGAQDFVVESGIAADDREMTRDDEEDAAPPPPRAQLRPAPRPAVFGDRAPPLRAVARDEPRFRPGPNQDT